MRGLGLISSERRLQGMMLILSRTVLSGKKRLSALFAGLALLYGTGMPAFALGDDVDSIRPFRLPESSVTSFNP